MEDIRQSRRHFLTRPLPLLVCSAVLFSACGSSPASTSSSTSTTRTGGSVQVMYAGSLESIMEKQVAPAFQQSTGYTFQGEAKGSAALANEIKGHLHQIGRASCRERV